MKIDAELEDLNEALLQMSSQVLENLKKALDYYFNQSVCEVNDDEIDQFERKIESECVKILLHERPYARDLKEVTGILKLVEDIERIGDHAEDIVTFLKKLNEKKGDYNSEVLELSDIVIGMYEDAIKSYKENNIELAQRVINRDDDVDRRYEKIIDDLANVNSKKGTICVEIYTAIVVKYLERIADHSVNVCEWLIYIVNGYHKDAVIL